MRSAREQTVDAARRFLQRTGWPRLQISLILALTGLAGFLASVVLLHLGLLAMWVRYPAAILIAYCIFLGLLRLWIRWYCPDERRADPSGDLRDLDRLDLGGLGTQSGPSPAAAEMRFGGGGDFGGGGASDSWSGGGGGGGGGSSSGSVDADEGWAIVVVAVVLLAALIAALYVVYIAPTLLAEILVDGALVTGLYRRLRREEQRYWLWTAVRRTWIPTIAITLFFVAGGVAVEMLVPNAHSMADVLRGAQAPSQR